MSTEFDWNPASGPAVFAVTEANSLGRRYDETAAHTRSPFQRDRDRIVHSTAFRRLEYKTQVFVNHEGDLYRTRLTHSLEVSQIGRSIARALRLNEDLTETICLAHDLGHTPFGHAGQEALNKCMGDHGGFEHNLQSLRVVDELEEKYADFPGLNLTFEAREGILKHCSARNARELGELGRRFLERTQPSLEAQLANIADEIAYNNHDVDDGLRSGLLTVEQLRAVPLFCDHNDTVRELHPNLQDRRQIHETVRRMIAEVVNDVIFDSRQHIEAAGPASIDDIRGHGTTLIGFSDAVRGRHLDLKAFLRDELYRHHEVLQMTEKARGIIHALFDAFFGNPGLLPREHAASASNAVSDSARARVVADYIAGMTDRYAIGVHTRLFK
ncbi:MAG: deoxyguanosinetriphosphate triphosphohydrolase [Gammaproteobacteria bacterium]|nr:deoxyguanosinetriphosphate triphosphohydrolase [Gammaproteobacteria bacterium]NNF62215.1 deoxyguanosinetriphosphate triphosphohydrolase [Gammaproteobacteria bacterium]NNM21012.1 deoxyguanosinetriphosphate triphosphohydrolase [Gammaproteobacteria bacterium]